MTSAAEGDPAWRPCGVISWTTDFGLADAYVGTMHGVALGIHPAARMIDLAHGIPAQDVAAASLQLRHAWPYLPAGSVHVAVVDPGVGTARRVLAGLQDGHAFVAPDNGLLAGVLDSRTAEVFEVDPDAFGLPQRSRTFHGRDVFAPLAAALAGGTDPRAVGQPVHDWFSSGDLWPAWEHGSPPERFEAPVLVIDRFGNAVSALEPARSGVRLRDYAVRVADQVVPVVDTYASADPGRPLALVDSWGHLEIAVRDGDAARLLGLQRGSPITLTRI